MRFLDAMNRDRCLFSADPVTLAGPDMPVCGAERTEGSRYCRRCAMRSVSGRLAWERLPRAMRQPPVKRAFAGQWAG